MSGDGNAQVIDADAPMQPRRRNAARTRALLLEVAIKRFTRHGYAATTVRDIADDAGVNVALINRYFTSKEGLFEACLEAAVTEINRDTEAVALDELAARMVRRLAGPADDRHVQDAMLTLLRTSGEERVDEMRRAVLQGFSRKLTAAAGEGQDDPALIRAQIVLAAALGVALLRSSLRLEPLASADEEALRAPMSDLINALFPR